MKYRKKPVVIEAVQFWQGRFAGQSFPAWLVSALAAGAVKVVSDKECEVHTLEDGADGRAKHVGSSGDWLILGVQGELYFCKPDIFAATYEPVDPSPGISPSSSVDG